MNEQTRISELVERVNGGESLQRVSKREGIQPASLLQRFRRAGYKLYITGNYVQLGPSSRLSERAYQVLIQTKGVKADCQTVALRLGFETVQNMDNYMQGFGFHRTSEGKYTPE